MLNYFEIKDCELNIEDSGAITPVLAARIEAAIHKLIDTDKEYLLPILKQNVYATEKDRNRISRLYLLREYSEHVFKRGYSSP